MSRSFKSKHNNNRTSFNKALKSDNKQVRHHNREFSRAVTKDPEIYDEELPKIRREVSDPWDYD